MKKEKIAWLGLLASVFLILVAVLMFQKTVSPLTSVPTGVSSSTGEFVVYAVDGKYSQVYEYSDAEWHDFLEKSQFVASLFSDVDIEWYDWDRQEILLTPSGSERLKRLKSEYFFITHHDYIVTLRGKRLYGGRVIDRLSQIAVRYPVIYIEDGSAESGWRMRLDIWPYHYFPIAGDYQGVAAPAKKVIEIEEIKQYFLAQKKLASL